MTVLEKHAKYKAYNDNMNRKMAIKINIGNITSPKNHKQFSYIMLVRESILYAIKSLFALLKNYFTSFSYYLYSTYLISNSSMYVAEFVLF